LLAHSTLPRATTLCFAYPAHPGAACALEPQLNVSECSLGETSSHSQQRCLQRTDQLCSYPRPPPDPCTSHRTYRAGLEPGIWDAGLRAVSWNPISASARDCGLTVDCLGCGHVHRMRNVHTSCHRMHLLERSPACCTQARLREAISKVSFESDGVALIRSRASFISAWRLSPNRRHWLNEVASRAATCGFF